MPPRLKSLELHGYKTFAVRTIFEYPADLTAIVGPNGSGKSNIADALRWVLGEQSYSLLRGRKTEDMIFAGSDQRPRAGMASATIVFNNDDGWLPIDFSEVSIARRAYRDGQNEYLLNGQRVRLKEISELLAQSGLAERTYTIIGQGLVDAALSLKPEERRRLFEEAAGIGLYRSRREEALNRLDSTRRNLERVQDILSELGPRLVSLERQARRAQEYERIKADLQVLLRDWYGFHWHQVQNEVARARGILQAQEARTEQVRQRYLDVESQVANLRGRLVELRNKLNAWHTQSAGLHQDREKISRDLAVMEERQISYNHQQQDLMSNLARLEEEQKARTDRLASIESEHKELESSLAEAAAELNTARQAYQARLDERSTVETTLSELRQTLVAGETNRIKLLAHRDEFDNRLEGLHRSVNALNQALKRDEETIQSAKSELEDITRELKTAESGLVSAEDALNKTRADIEEFESRLRNRSNELARLEAEQTKLSTQLEVLLQAEKSFSGLNQGARYLLEAARQGRIKGNLQALSSLVVVPPELEVAIASVLGEYLDGILVKDQTETESVLALLGEGEKGRAVLFQLELAKHEPAIVSPIDPDCIGLAKDLVNGPEDLQPLLNLLLGQVIVVRNRQAINRLLNRTPKTARLVTLQGEVFWGNGIVIAGQDGRAGMIGRPRQKSELQTGLGEVKKSISALVEKIHRDEEDLKVKRLDFQKQETDLRAARQHMEKLTQASQKAGLEMDRLKQKNTLQQSQLKEYEEQIRQTEINTQANVIEIKKVEDIVKSLNNQIREQNHHLANIAVDELQGQVTNWTTNAAVAKKALEDNARRLAEIQQAIAENESQRGAFHERLANMTTTLATLETEKNTKRTEENRLNAVIEELQKEILPAETDLETLEQENTRLQENQSAAQQSLAVAERYATQAQLELGKHRDALDSLQRRVEEDFGLVAFEYASDVSGPTPLPIDGLVQQLPSIKEISPELEDNIARHRAQLRRIGPINPEALSEFESVQERHGFLTDQVEDLKKADSDLRQVIEELDDLMKKEFKRTFEAVALEFREMFHRLFGGGSAHLLLTDEDNPAETGIDIEARLPGRREQGLSLLSGGERSLTAAALVFSLLKVSPTPFCVLDEVDAMLDEANVGRFCELLKELSAKTQFIVITHNRNTVQAADVIYGVTMGRDSSSQVISLKLDEVSDELVR